MGESEIHRALRHLDIEVSNAAVAVNSVRNMAHALRTVVEAKEQEAEVKEQEVEATTPAAVEGDSKYKYRDPEFKGRHQ